MPSYVYECSDCEQVIEVFHSMSEEKTDCETCGTKNTLNRIPEIPTYTKSSTAGKVVKRHIEEAKKQIKEDKKSMTEDYKN